MATSSMDVGNGQASSEDSPRKRCRSCARLRERSAFYAYATNRDGLHTRCKECVRTYYRERYRAKRAASGGGRREAEGGAGAARGSMVSRMRRR